MTRAVHGILESLASLAPQCLDHLLQASMFAFAAILLCACVPANATWLRHSVLLAAILRFALPAPWIGHLVDSSALKNLLPAKPHLLGSPLEFLVDPFTWMYMPPQRDPAMHSEIWCVLVALWSLGALSFLSLQTVRLCRVCAIVWRARQRGSRSGLRILESEAISQPGLWGLWVPVILLPATLRSHLTADELEAVLLHEEAHYKRRDNWISALQLAVSAVFWFHPLIWWINRRIGNERELACDLAVLARGVPRDQYLSVIAKVCRLSTVPPAVCIAASGGSNLQQRMEWIMNREVQFSARVWERLAGRAALIGAIVAGLGGAFLGARPLLAQKPTAPASSGAHAKWLNEDVAYIITPVERARFELLTSEAEREKFIEQFWQVRDPTPGSHENENKEEHYRRIAYANARFAGETPGWQTDRGRIYIVFGPPDEIEDHPSERYEKWRYRKGMFAGMWLEFRDVD